MTGGSVALAGKHVVRLVPIEPQPTRRSPGAWKGLIHVEPDAFDTRIDTEIQELFEGGEDTARW